MPLPPGLLLNHETGELTGVPTVPGTYAIQLKVRDLLGSERELTDTVVINAYTPLSWSGNLGFLMATRVPAGITVQRSGGLEPFSFVVFSGAMPDGMTVDSATGAILGTPSTHGGYAFTMRVTDDLGQFRDYVLAGTVVENLELSHVAQEVDGVVGDHPLVNPAIRTGGTAPFSYAITSGTLPAGLVMSATTGTISGTPAATSNAVVDVTVTDAQGYTATSTLTFDIRQQVALSGTFARGMVGKAYARQFTATQGHMPYIYSVTSAPPGVSINSGTGLFSGTPTFAGTYNTTAFVTDAIGVVKSISGSLEIAQALGISGTYTANAARSIPYPKFTASVVGGFAPYSFSISAGSLPPGLSLHTTLGEITGTPTTQGSYNATLRVTDADGSFAEMAVNISIAGDVTITGSVPARGTLTVPFTGDTLGVTGGTSPYVWSIITVSGGLPPGLSINTSTGDITGTPTTAGTYQFRVRVTDANSSFSDSAVFTTTVVAYPTLTGDLPDDTRTTSYSASLSRAGGHAPYAFDLSAGSLPNGLSINATNGAITGTSTVAGSFNFTVRVTDDAGNIATSAQNITIYEPVVITGGYATDGEVGHPYPADGNETTGGKAPIAWSLAGGTLPPGLSLSGAGTISGTPTTAGSYSFTVRATDALGFAPSVDYQIVIAARLAITGDYTANAEAQVAYNQDLNTSGGFAPVTWSIASGTVPTGTTLNTSTGTLSGTPTTPGTYNFTVRATDGFGVTADRAEQVVVTAAIDMSGTAPSGTQGVSYSFTPTVTGGFGTRSFSHVAGTFPAGCTLNSSTGQIGGTPTAGNVTYNPTLRVTSALGGFDNHALSIYIGRPPSFTANYPRGMVGKGYSGTTSSVIVDHSPGVFSLADGNYPPGISLNSGTGNLTGTPSLAGTHWSRTRLTDGKGNIFDRVVGIDIAEALTITGTYANGQQGVAYSSQIAASGGWPARTFSHVAGTLPAGLSLNASTGALTGTPNTATTYNFTIRVIDADGAAFDKAFTVTIASSVAYSVSASPNPAVAYDSTSIGNPITVSATSTVSVVGGTAPHSHSWSFVSAVGSTTAMTITFPTSNSIRGSRTGSLYNRQEVWRDTVTDALGQVRTVDVTIHLQIDREPDGGGGGIPP